MNSPLDAMGSSGDGVLVDDGSAAQQRFVGLHQDHRLPSVLAESGVKLSSATGHGVVVTDAARAGSGSHKVGLAEVGLHLLALHQLLLLIVDLHALLLVGGLDALLASEGTAWGLVAAVIEGGADQLGVVLSEVGGWPGVDVVGVTAALAQQVATDVTAVDEGHAEQLLLLGEDDGRLGDDSDGVAELQLGAVHGGGTGLGHNGEGLVLLSAVGHDVGHVVGGVSLAGWDVVGALEGGRVDYGAGGGLGRQVAGGLGRNVTGGGRTSGRRGNVARGGVGGLGCRLLVTAAHVRSEATGRLKRRKKRTRKWND